MTSVAHVHQLPLRYIDFQRLRGWRQVMVEYPQHHCRAEKSNGGHRVAEFQQLSHEFPVTALLGAAHRECSATRRSTGGSQDARTVINTTRTDYD